MMHRSRHILRTAAIAAAALGFAAPLSAEPAPLLNVYTTGVAQSAMRILQIAYSHYVRRGWENGPNFTQTMGTDGTIVSEVRKGVDADIVIVQTKEMAKLVQDGLIRPGTAHPLGRVDVGVAVKTGTPHPDISTYPKFRDALLAAGTVGYTDPKLGSAGGNLIQTVLDKPEFAHLKRVYDFMGSRLAASGAAPIALETEGTLLTTYGVDYVGKVPESLNAHLEFSIGVGANSKSPEEAVAFEQYLLEPSLAPIWTKWGVIR